MILDEDAIEHMVDRVGIVKVLEILTNMCEGKADHLRANWQDDTQAKDWEKMAVAVRVARLKCRRIRGDV